MMTDLSKLITRAEALLARLEAIVPQPVSAPDWNAAHAFRWRKRGNTGYLQPVPHPHCISLDDLRDIDEQKKVIERNTRQFVNRLPANNILLTGARGTGKSSLVKAVLGRFAKKGLRLIEVDKEDLIDLPDIVDLIASRPERFIVYCDDLSFEAGESTYKALKAVIDGSIAGTSDNVLIYATSNRRHLMPEYISENSETKHVGGEIHPSEGVEEKISLSERFGIWLSFYPFNQQQYLDIVEHWIAGFGIAGNDKKALHDAALLWALSRGSRSGRVAWQFARDWVGRQGKNEDTRMRNERRSTKPK